MTEEPYRWLETVGHRREYIADQLKGGTPVFALSRPEGILLFGVGQGQSKVFEVFDRHAMAAFGHPADIEKVRQMAIQAAHVEGFNRSAEDVSLRRLVNFGLSPRLKGAFDQIFSPPIIVESLFAELGNKPEDDVVCRLNYDGDYEYMTQPVAVATRIEEKEASDWLNERLNPHDPWEKACRYLLAVWEAFFKEEHIVDLDSPAEDKPLKVEAGSRQIELALLDRHAKGPNCYRSLRVVEESRIEKE